MIIQILRILTLILVIFSIIVDVDIPIILHTQINQLIIAIIIIIIILLIDEIIGFLLGLLFLILYFKYYQKLIKNNSSLKEPLITNNNNDNYDNNNNIINNNNDKNKEIKPITNNKIEQLTDHYIKYSNDCIEMPYISNELLDKAQNNIFDVNNYNQEIRITNDTYGVQGLNSDTIHYPAFDNSYLRFDNYDNKL